MKKELLPLNYENTGRFIRKCRIERGLKLKDFAAAMKATPQFAYAIESGISLPPKNKVRIITKTLGIHPSHISGMIAEDYHAMACKKMVSMGLKTIY